jgi:hypothetical protein
MEANAVRAACRNTRQGLEACENGDKVHRGIQNGEFYLVVLSEKI